MVCPPVRGDNPLALASGLSPIQADKPTCNYYISLSSVLTLLCTKILLLYIILINVDLALYKNISIIYQSHQCGPCYVQKYYYYISPSSMSTLLCTKIILLYIILINVDLALYKNISIIYQSHQCGPCYVQKYYYYISPSSMSTLPCTKILLLYIILINVDLALYKILLLYIILINVDLALYKNITIIYHPHQCRPCSVQKYFYYISISSMWTLLCTKILLLYLTLINVDLALYKILLLYIILINVDLALYKNITIIYHPHQCRPCSVQKYFYYISISSVWTLLCTKILLLYLTLINVDLALYKNITIIYHPHQCRPCSVQKYFYYISISSVWTLLCTKILLLYITLINVDLALYKNITIIYHPHQCRPCSVQKYFYYISISSVWTLLCTKYYYYISSSSM